MTAPTDQPLSSGGAARLDRIWLGQELQAILSPDAEDASGTWDEHIENSTICAGSSPWLAPTGTDRG